MPATDRYDPCFGARRVEVLRTLGRGRAAEAQLVRVEADSGGSIVCVEKTFAPGLLTRLIYRMVYQAPFGYQFSRDAILACYYRRRVVAALAAALLDGVRVSRPLYVRWNAERRAFVLGTEWIEGRGIRPAPADPYVLRRRLARVVRKSPHYAPPPAHEVSKLLATMRALENLLRSCGLVGSGWQVCPSALVSTANLLRTAEGYTAVDLESGIPAMLVGKYVIDGAQLGAFPLFDDLDPQRLRRWLAVNRDALCAEMKETQLRELGWDAERLIEHTSRWKQAEPALGRNGRRVFGRQFWKDYTHRLLEIWQRRDVVDGPTLAAAQSGRRIVVAIVFLLGLLPGKPGRLLQRLYGHRVFRQKAGRFLRDTSYRREKIGVYIDAKTQQWREQGRIGPQLLLRGRRMLFAINWLLGKCAPTAVHRWLADPARRRMLRVRLFLLIVSERFQSAYGRHVIRKAIRSWHQAERISDRRAAALYRQARSAALQEYACGFGLHLGLKIFSPLVYSVKISGLAAFVQTGDPLFLLSLLLLPACRTGITLWRMLRRRDPHTEFGDALLVGMLPGVGSLAFPVQMYSSQRELSMFLLRDAASRAGRWLPIYGGKDSRVEIWAIRLMDPVIELIDIGVHATSAVRRMIRPALGDGAAAAARVLKSRRGPWDHLLDEQLRWFLRMLQESDRYHARKHFFRSRPDQCSGLGIRIERPWWIRLHRRMFRPLTLLRRQLLVRLGIRTAVGHGDSEAFPEEGHQPKRAA